MFILTVVRQAKSEKNVSRGGQKAVIKFRSILLWRQNWRKFKTGDKRNIRILLKNWGKK